MHRIKIFLSGSLIAFGLGGNAYAQDTLWLSPRDLADSVTKQLTPSNFSTGLLLERLLPEDSWGFVREIQNNPSITKDADIFYGSLQELFIMNDGRAQVPDPIATYDAASMEVARYEFDEQMTVIPIGILDYEYHDLDLSAGLANQQLYYNGPQLFDQGSSSAPLYSKQRIRFVAPVFDNMELEELNLVADPAWFITDDPQGKQVIKFEFMFNGQWVTQQLGVPFTAPLNVNSVEQTYKFRVTYLNGEVFSDILKVNTPTLPFMAEAKGGWTYCEDDWVGEFEDSGNKIQWCLIPSCKSKENHPDEVAFYSPFLLVTGYRPPLIGQSFKKTYEIYSHEHDQMLKILGDRQVDVFLVRFNIHMKPFTHGMQESADLLEQFINWLNQNKLDPYSENIIQGSSMGSDIARLTLMKMEKKHMSAGAEHHHTRLFNSYDANFFGANIPLAYQYLIKSSVMYPNFHYGPAWNWPRIALNLFLNSVVQQKTVKELLMYHSVSGNITEAHFFSPLFFMNNTPGIHDRRQDYYDALAQYDTGSSIVPLPYSPRHIAVSLGKINGLNSDESDWNFNAPNNPWRYAPVFLNPGSYNASGYDLIYSNIGIRYLFGTFSVGLSHRVKVRGMHELDNAAGSRLSGTGNLVEVGDNTYFPLLPNGIQQFTHKPVLTAFAIPSAFWPTDGSFSVDIHSLDLMYQSEAGLIGGTQSHHYGYPNLGRPLDHFSVTPFEAIYVDHRINNHIQLDDDDPTDRSILTNFLLDEYQPNLWFLQNDRVGSQARMDYRYRYRRAAPLSITVGKNVTPSTDKGEYFVQKNADVILQAGTHIDLLPGTQTELGALGLFYIGYEACARSEGERSPEKNLSTQTTTDEYQMTADLDAGASVVVYPNPSSNGVFKVKLNGDDEITGVVVTDLRGTVVYASQPNRVREFISEEPLNHGVYLITIQLGDRSETVRYVVL